MLSTKIKEHTAFSHKQLESHALFRNLSGTFDEQEYLKLLIKLQTYYQSLEKAYVPFFKDVSSLEIAKRQRAHILSEDIKNRSGATSVHTIDVPVIDSIYKATGALYVIEGSTLGARFISQSLAQSGLHASNGAAYFSGYGEETGTMWKTFVQFMNEVSSSEEEEQEVITTAEDVFSSLYKWLDRND